MAISKKSFVNLDLQGNALVNPTIGANTDMTKAGSFQYNSVDNRLEYFNGSTIETVANLGDVTGALDFQGGYDAATNTPDLTTPVSGAIKKGYYWVVTAAGTFFGEPLAIGDSLFAQVDNPASLGDWVIVQGNVDLATEEVAGIVRLATQAEVDDGTEGGAVVVTPATLQGKIDAQITPEINNKLPLAGGTMSGDLNMGNNGFFVNAISNVSGDSVRFATTIDADNNIIRNLAAPTDNGDATNKTYVDTAVSTAQANAEAYADSLAPNYDPAGAAATAESNANTYTDNQIAAQSYTAVIATGDWTLNAGVYEYTITHNLGSYVTFTAFYDGATADFNGSYAANTLTVYSNSLPSANTVVNVVKAGGNI